jgi:hypothetical protein
MNRSGSTVEQYCTFIIVIIIIINIDYFYRGIQARDPPARIPYTFLVYRGSLQDYISDHRAKMHFKPYKNRTYILAV